METLFIYLIKSSGVLILLYLGYYFLLRKETFFTTNRWFLLSGLFTALLLPLIVYTKVVLVETTSPIIDWSRIPAKTSTVSDSFEMNWFLIFGIIYGIGTLVFMAKFVFDFYSLSRILKGKSIQSQADFKLIDTNENLAPFSYFNTIVYNSNLYTAAELENILEHEKVHCEQNHTTDVLVSIVFCILFWFNPLIWLYKKAILQNLEFIADHEATKKITDKKAYQITLLKITTHENCVAISNHFYQSLIKKRIVMLNKNQSNKRNSWKYAAVIPALIAFVILFQIKVIAQIKNAEVFQQLETSNSENNLAFSWTKNTSEKQLQKDSELANSLDLDLIFSKIKRNSKNEITQITILYQDKIGNKYVQDFSKNNGIDPIYFRKSIDENGKGEIGFYNNQTYQESNEKDENLVSIYNSHYDSDIEDKLIRLFIINGKPYTKEQLKGKNIAIIDATIVKLEPAEAVQKYGEKAKDGAVVFQGKTKIIDSVLDKDSSTKEVSKKVKAIKIIDEQTKPLIIINGKKQTADFDLKSIDSNTIAAINVLKNEKATEKYGKEGINGVIEITTKDKNVELTAPTTTSKSGKSFSFTQIKSSTDSLSGKGSFKRKTDVRDLNLEKIDPTNLNNKQFSKKTSKIEYVKVTSDKNTIDEAEIYIDGVKSTKAALDKISPSAIEKMEVNKSDNDKKTSKITTKKQ